MYLQSLGELALGSRLKALSDQFYAAADATYATLDAGIEARWFPLLRYLRDNGSATVTEAADAIGQTHSAVSQLCDRLAREKLVARRRCSDDGRRTWLVLTPEGVRRLGTLGPAWCAIRRAAAAAAGGDNGLMKALADCEAALARRPLLDTILDEHARLMQASIEVQAYRPMWREAFHRLNAQWLERHFVIENIDREVLRDPETHVLAPGGAILVATLDGEAIGTCALLKEADGLYELSKMAVDESFRGLGAGRLLLDATIGLFQQRGGGTLFLESNSRLRTAVGMYERAGFVHQPQPRPGSHYARADVYMIYQSPADA